jgi:hypothetical protein
MGTQIISNLLERLPSRLNGSVIIPERGEYFFRVLWAEFISLFSFDVIMEFSQKFVQGIEIYENVASQH